VRIALTGTPGVGKTTLAAVAARHGWRVVDVKAWAGSEGCVAGWDAEDQAEVIDVARLSRRVPADDGSQVLYEGHLSHLLPLDGAWVVRLDPEALRDRLERRGYPPAKVRENVEAEAVDLILQEALDRHPRRLVQRDGTHRTPEALYDAFAAAGVEGLERPDIEAVQWLERL
jgi:adenylate kinase